jgi:acetyltransferase-like isoleucine patch superfamily enzyme
MNDFKGSWGKFTVVPDDVNTFVPVEIGSFTSIASGLTIVSGQHPCVEFPLVVSTFPFYEWNVDDNYPPSKMGGKVTIGSDVWIGQDVTILEGVEVGHGAIVGAGSVVTKNVLEYEIVAGNPAEVKSSRFDFPKIAELIDIAWWDWDMQKIIEAVPYMTNIDRFIEKYGINEQS